MCQIPPKKICKVLFTLAGCELFMPVLLICRWQCVVCLKVTDILSYRDKHADRISQLNCNRKSATPFLAEDYANKLLPTGPRGIPPHPDPSLPRTAAGPVNRTGRPMSSLTVCMWLGTFMGTRQTCKLQLFFFTSCFCLEEIRPSVRFQTTSFQVQIVRRQRICKHHSAASLLCQWAGWEML